MERRVLLVRQHAAIMGIRRYRPSRNWMMSRTNSGRPVMSASRRASVDLPPPALPNTATFLMVMSSPFPARAPVRDKSAHAIVISVRGKSFPLLNTGTSCVAAQA